MHKKTTQITTFILFILMGTVSFTSLSTKTIFALTPTEVFDSEFDEYIEDFIEYVGGPQTSIALALINDTNIVHVKGYGNQTSTDTVYQLGRISQLFTAISIMQLHEEGLIDLEADINDYLPYDLRNPNYPTTPVKIKYLLTQTSTIRNPEEYWLMIMNEGNNFSDIFYELLHEDGSEFGDSWWPSEPGTFSFSASLPFDLLAHIVELITSMNFTQYVTENILEPLSMNSTKLDFTEYENNLVAPPYIVTNYENITLPHRNYDGRGSCGWRTTIEDFKKILYTFMHGSYAGTSIFSQTSLDLMYTTTEVSPNYGLGISFNVQGSYIGLSSNVRDFPLAGSMGCFSIMYFDNEIGVAALSNTHLLHTELQDDSDRFFNFIESSIRKLIPTEQTDYDILAVPLVFTLIGSIIVLVRRRK